MKIKVQNSRQETICSLGFPLNRFLLSADKFVGRLTAKRIPGNAIRGQHKHLIFPIEKGVKIMVEYALMLGGLLGLRGESFFNFDSVVGIASIFISGVGLFILGYAIKGIWGAVATFSIGTFLFFYFKGLLPL
jgi:hypothetical protein